MIAKKSSRGSSGFEKMTPEQLKAAQDKGHQKKKENNARRRQLKEELEILLSDNDLQARMSMILINRVLNNERDAVKAYEVIRDTLGEKPKEQIEAVVDNKVINVTLEDE